MHIGSKLAMHFHHLCLLQLSKKCLHARKPKLSINPLAKLRKTEVTIYTHTHINWRPVWWNLRSRHRRQIVDLGLLCSRQLSVKPELLICDKDIESESEPDFLTNALISQLEPEVLRLEQFEPHCFTTARWLTKHSVWIASPWKIKKKTKKRESLHDPDATSDIEETKANFCLCRLE